LPQGTKKTKNISDSNSKPITKVSETAEIRKKEANNAVNPLENIEDNLCCGNDESCCKPKSKSETKAQKEKAPCGDNCGCVESQSTVFTNKKLKVFFGSQTGTSKLWAETLARDAKSRGMLVTTKDLASSDPEDFNQDKEAISVVVISTYTDGQPPETCATFYSLLDDVANDFRVSKNHFEGVKYAVFGIGHSVYGNNFNAVAKAVDKMLHGLSASRLVPVGLGDNGAGVEVIEAYSKWVVNFWNGVEKSYTTPIVASPKVSKVSDDPDEDMDDVEEGEPLVDVEDLGKMIKPVKKPKKAKVVQEEEEAEDEDEDEDEEEEEPNPTGEVKEMVTPSLKAALTKQGYRVLGSHSGVKMCRWTKSMLRGRGGCYKHSFYGIASHQCMEMTPSLACANKCVFCWRHHKNPVGKEWKWKADDPDMLIDAAIKNHHQMIKQMKGVPGVVKERFDEAFNIRHCALSLVGEPIIYPHINRFVDLLHSKKISSFMVTNAQFPDKIDELKPVTQLYISVDAATKDSLKKVDRPLFADFWERFLACIDALKKKGQRTVFRLTLIKDWNMEEIRNYAELIERGRPSFVEIKGVTYCGTSNASSLTIKNVPFHQEVIRFANEILAASPVLSEEYGLACEHEHSCCVLIADKKFKINGKWHTWIDYEKFHSLVKSGNDFSALDYAEETPSWAVVGSDEHGFDPEEVRFKRNKQYQNSGC